MLNHVVLDKTIVVQELQLRRGVTNTPLLNSLYDDAVIDVCNFCNLKVEEITIFLLSAIKDLIMYRYNTIGGEGVIQESLTGSSIQYTQDIPQRIKTQLRKHRRLVK